MATKADIQLHYDTESAFFESILGKSMSYTCADWTGQTTLEEAQYNKIAKITKYAGINQHTQSVIDLGCGWGSTLGWIAQRYPNLVKKHGVNISTEQTLYARRRFGPLGIDFYESDMVNYLENYAGEPYDAAIAIGSTEHVATPKDYKQGVHIDRYAHYFKLVRQHVSGRMGLQVIVSIKEPNQLKGESRARAIRFQYYISKHVFPNSLTPRVDYISAAVKGLYEIDQFEVNSHEYAKTIMCWRERLLDVKDAIPVDRYDLFLRYFDLCIEHFESGYIGLARFSLKPA